MKSELGSYSLLIWEIWSQNVAINSTTRKWKFLKELRLSKDIIYRRLQKCKKCTRTLEKSSSWASQANHRGIMGKPLQENTQNLKFFKRIVTCDKKGVYLWNLDSRRQLFLCGPINSICFKTRTDWKEVYDQCIMEFRVNHSFWNLSMCTVRKNRQYILSKILFSIHENSTGRAAASVLPWIHGYPIFFLRYKR